MAVFVFGAAAGTVPLYAAPTAVSVNPNAQAAALAVAKGPAAAQIGDDTVTACAAIPSAVARDTYGAEVVKAFEPLITGTNPDAALNAAITIAKLHTLSSEGALERMLNNPNAAIRYWAAKGIGEIVGLANSLPGAAIAALKGGLAKETSGLIKKEIMRSLAVLASAPDISQALDVLVDNLRTTAPDQPTLEAMSIGLTRIATLVKSTPPAAGDVSKIVKTASWTASLVTQHLLAMSDAAAKSKSNLPDGYQANAVAVINHALGVLDAASGKSQFTQVTPDAKPDEIKFAIDAVTGSAGVGGGQVQKIFTGVPVPPVIKTVVPVTTSRPAKPAK